ncbi:beta-N-acetylhexosaminidase [Mucilaginibacter sabulilitoris]|uniref:beta-N-acetylhexosaminidase n=1 Tax=Mucilaginibacter sabulilitoris TaxID=1173583 RepID=A0ABZ0TLJ1_9SPHI|nr:beta-N-acetylhexosaminidase [Mucilaginibacter sabulilitoris]WPU92035.1 beta-N-acetylhexosaminidase [Mucilaginibacter sabulilitoris]
MKKTGFLFLFLWLSFAANAQSPAIIPQPAELKVINPQNTFIIDSHTIIYISGTELLNATNFLNNYLQKHYGFMLAVTQNKKEVGDKAILLLSDSVAGRSLKGYQLLTKSRSLTINAPSAENIFYGIQTLIQLLPTEKISKQLPIPAVEITDYPRFAYRGMHLDVSRHFFDTAFVKKYIDYLAMHKMNYFHWHLTDDHGWRIEIKKHPELTTVGAWRNGTIIGLYPGTGNDGKRYGGYYTQDQIKDIVHYAAERYITIIPEIEMPGHSMGVLAAHPELSTTPNEPKQVAQTWGIFNKFNNVLVPSEATFTLLEDVLTEVIALFPSPYIHVGGDECSKIWWNQSAFCRDFVKEKGLKDMNGLQSYFMHRIEKFVNSKGRTIIGWDEILDGGVAPNATVMSWRGETGGIQAAKLHHRVIMTPEKYMYFNHAQFEKEDSLTAAKYVPLQDVYHYDPLPAQLSQQETQYIWGAQGNLWSEYVASPAKAEYMIFPRLDALSEILWTPKPKQNYSDFRERLKTQFKRYDLMRVNYSKRYLQTE